MTKRAFYFGCTDGGHFMQYDCGKKLYDPKKSIPAFPWSHFQIDGGLLKNGKVKDVPTGEVYSVCGGDPLWIAFFWWDRSGDHRPGSNSGFYVTGFTWEQREEAFTYACSVFRKIVKRQTFPLVLK